MLNWHFSSQYLGVLCLTNQRYYHFIREIRCNINACCILTFINIYSINVKIAKRHCALRRLHQLHTFAPYQAFWRQCLIGEFAVFIYFPRRAHFTSNGKCKHFHKIKSIGHCSSYFEEKSNHILSRVLLRKRAVQV